MEKKIEIITPSRLHFSLIDLEGSLGRIDGGFGVAINKPRWHIEIEPSKKMVVPLIAKDTLSKIGRALKLKNNYRIIINEKVPMHVGLGSKTQLSLAIAMGILKLEGKEIPVRELASIVGRGGTSGIGVAAFEKGGFILDCGHSTKEKKHFLPSRYSICSPPLVLVRYEIPENWHFIVCIPKTYKIFGKKELQAFKRYCPISPMEVEKLSRIVLFKLLPSVLENDPKNFGDGIDAIQKIGFKKIENEIAGNFIRNLRKFLSNEGYCGGLSSFGPTCFSLIDKKSTAEKIARKTKEYL
ncbi:MAG: beta-ribofuranosylaminobenzene 5'-phosphate synthase family protein, partial [Candidatus Thermoplasmatota archaeon]